ncbi:GAF domain-containing sensor histidine kinase [Gloeothece verrucosa]|uniref:histidine kinase n=1 Tax=Gloeothece verrucosa (strain PCC 7822) TaxID=497965 RepID=E0UFU2_GLOV7|nr:ATP-binding protein [Gloeothece verrucosa]ADN14325.1 GAF sensor signal transduction histidine kinase [Gloeothece verrucosa PCC 7822]
MSNSLSILISPSAELVSLCQSQVELLSEGFKADWTAVYLTAKWEENASSELLPVVSYPEQFSWQNGKMTSLPGSGDEEKLMLPSLWQTLPERLNDAETQIESFNYLHKQEVAGQNNQLILPLIYEEIVMGLLVTVRKDLPWRETELTQIEKIVKTLALGCFLDQRQEWYKQQLQQQYAKSAHQRDRLDNLLHQLRNPLTALRTFGKLLLKRLLADERDQNVVKGIIRESDRIQDLLRQFEEENHLEGENIGKSTSLALPEAQANSPLLLPSITLSLEFIAIDEVLTPLLISAQALAQEKQIGVTSTIPTNLPAIKANFAALREVLTNLIDNAIKYTPAGGQVDVSVKFKKEDNWETIEISDTGYGIPQEDQQHIFERRYRGVQAEGSIPGTGLGLAIVKDLVEQMQGKIEFISPNRKSQKASCPGTTFIVGFKVRE